MAAKKLFRQLRPLTGLLFIGIFLVFSYCPVRTTLISLLHTGNHLPVKKGVPEIKTSVYQVCTDYDQRNTIFISTMRAADHSPLPLLLLATAILVWFRLFKTRFRIRFKPIGTAFHSVPLYLINRVLVI